MGNHSSRDYPTREERLKDMEMRRQQQQREHEQRMKQLEINAKERDRKAKEKQRQAAIAGVQKEIEKLEKGVNSQKKELQEVLKDQKTISDEIVRQKEEIKNFEVSFKSIHTNKSNNNDDVDEEKKNTEESEPEKSIDNVQLKARIIEEKKQMEAAYDEWKRSDDEILAAIAKTGQDEGNVGRFLRLTHKLIGQTTATQANADTLNVKLQNFQTLIQRATQDKVTVKYYFEEEKNLGRFVPILNQQGFKHCEDLACTDQQQFQSHVMKAVEAGINKQRDEWKRRHPNEVDPFDAFFEKYKLQKFKAGLEGIGLTSLDDINDLEDKEIDELISEAKITGLFKKKFRRAIKDVQDDKYPPKTHADDKKEAIKKSPKETQPDEITEKEKMDLEDICLKPDKTWQPVAKEKADNTKATMLNISPVLGTFFDRMQGAAQQAQKLLAIESISNDKLNEQQVKAMRIAMDNKPIVNAPKDTEDNKEENEKRKAWKEASKVQVFSKTLNKWVDGSIIKITNDDEGEWLEIKYDTGSHERTKQVDRFGPDVRDPIMTECRAISKQIMVDMDVVSSLQEEFEKEGRAVALPIAKGAEESVCSVMQSQSQMRQSIKLAADILKLKPANLTDAAKPLWDTVDGGIINIFNSFLVMNRASAEYFGFFLRFNQSFQQFTSMNKQNPDVSLFTSLESIKHDTAEFIQFKETFDKRLKELTDEATKVIKEGVKKHCGDEVFEKARASREQSEQEYLNKKMIYDKKISELKQELEDKKTDLDKNEGRKAALQVKEKQLNEDIERNQRYLDSYRTRKDELIDIKI